MPRGTATRWKTRYSVRLTVPRRDGWRAWGTVRAGFEHALADLADPAITAAEIASEHRRGADYVRVTVVLAVAAADLADALAMAWDAFTGAAGDDLTGWEIPAAAAEVQPELPSPFGGGRGHRSGLGWVPGITRKSILSLTYTSLLLWNSEPGGVTFSPLMADSSRPYASGSGGVRVAAGALCPCGRDYVRHAYSPR